MASFHQLFSASLFLDVAIGWKIGRDLRNKPLPEVWLVPPSQVEAHLRCQTRGERPTWPPTFVSLDFSKPSVTQMEMLSREALDQNRTSFFQTLSHQFEQLFQDHQSIIG